MTMRYSRLGLGGWITATVTIVVAGCAARNPDLTATTSSADDLSCGDLVVVTEDGDGGFTTEDGGAFDPGDDGGVCSPEASVDDESSPTDDGSDGSAADESGDDGLLSGEAGDDGPGNDGDDGSPSAAGAMFAPTLATTAAVCWSWDPNTGRGGPLSTQCSMRLAGPRGGTTVSHGPSRHVFYRRICGRTCNPDRSKECYPSRRAICEKCARLLAGLGDTDAIATFSTTGQQWCQGLGDASTCYWSLTSGDDPVTFDNMDSWCWIRDPADR
jgi:hypothetical protein